MSDIWALTQASFFAWLFLCVWVIYSCFFICLVISCRKLDILSSILLHFWILFPCSSTTCFYFSLLFLLVSLLFCFSEVCFTVQHHDISACCSSETVSLSTPPGMVVVLAGCHWQSLSLISLLNCLVWYHTQLLDSNDCWLMALFFQKCCYKLFHCLV